MYDIVENVKFFQFSYIGYTYKRCKKLEKLDTFYNNIHIGLDIFEPSFGKKVTNLNFVSTKR